MADLTPAHRDLLNPFGEIFGKMDEQIFDMSDADLKALSQAVNAVNTRNCWCMIYDAAQWLRGEIDGEFLRRSTNAAGEALKP